MDKGLVFKGIITFGTILARQVGAEGSVLARSLVRLELVIRIQYSVMLYQRWLAENT